MIDALLVARGCRVPGALNGHPLLFWWQGDAEFQVRSMVTHCSPDLRTGCGKTAKEALPWCLAWLMAPELGIVPFLV